MNCADIHIIATRTSEFELTEESIRSGAQTAKIASGSAQNKINTHHNSDTSQTSSRETTPSRSEASGELENENEDAFQGQQYDPIGPVDETTESCRLRLLAASGFKLKNVACPPLTFSPCKVISQPTILSLINLFPIPLQRQSNPQLKTRNWPIIRHR